LWPWREWQFQSGLWRWMPWLSSFFTVAVFESHNHIIGSLFLVPIIYATIVFRWQGAMVVFLFSLIGISSVLSYYRNAMESRLTNIGILLLPAVVMLAVSVELELRRKNKNIYLEKEKERQIYLAKILEAQEKERQNLAEELHDQSIQTLLAVASYAESIELADEDLVEIRKKAALIKEKTRATVDELRRISIDLRPSILDDMGLVPALKWLTSRANKENHVYTQMSINGLKPELPQAIEVHVFRIVQEALRNIERHAKATEAFIILDAGDNSLTILVRDNGQGFILPNKLDNLVTEGKLGIIGMQERVKSLDGTFEIHSSPDQGTSLSIEIPY
jgi:two-component system sensor histidine kinase DegS